MKLHSQLTHITLTLLTAIAIAGQARAGNIAEGLGAYVAGGDDNGVDSAYGTVVGGFTNVVTGDFAAVVGGASNVVFGAEFGFIGGGLENAVTGYGAVVPGGKLNYATGTFSFAAGQRAAAMHAGAFVWADSSAADFSSTTSNQFLIRAGGGVGIGTAITTNAMLTVAGDVLATGRFIGDGSGLTNLPGGGGGTITGTGLNIGTGNTLSGSYATIAGGTNNAASGNFSVIVGGLANTASGLGAFIGGGGYDGATVLGNAATSTGAVVVGGTQNTATGSRSTIGGGHDNLATNWYATVPGGAWNVAGGQGSFAAGRAAKALHDGTFVWSDNWTPDFISTAPQQFLIRAAGGVGIGTNHPATALHVNGTITASGYVGDGSGLTNVTAQVANGSITSSKLAAGSVDNSKLANTTVTINAGTGLSGGGSGALGGSVTLNNSGVLNVTGTGNIASSGGQNPQLSFTGILPVSNGGLGAAIAPTAGQFLRGNGSGTWAAGPIQAGDLPSGATGYIQNQSAADQAASIRISGNITAAKFIGDGSGLTGLPTSPAGSGFSWQFVAGATQSAQPNTGYIVTNADVQTTITLPASPNVGDIIRVTGAGTAGWKIAQNAGQSIQVGTVATALGAGTTWNLIETNSLPWVAMAASADGSKLAAIGTVKIDTRQIYVSINSGQTWTARPLTKAWQAIAMSADGSLLVAVAKNDQIYASTDFGATWTASASKGSWSALASSADGSKVVAAISGGNIYIKKAQLSHTGGWDWLNASLRQAANWTAVASSADGSKLVAVADNDLIYTSVNFGTNWTSHATSQHWSAVASSADGNRLVAVVKGGQIYTSSDAGANWIARAHTGYWSAVVSSADGSRLAAADSLGAILASTDFGFTWQETATLPYCNGLGSSADGTKLIAVTGVAGASKSSTYGKIYASTPLAASSTSTTTAGTTGYLTGSQGAAIELQYIGNSRFLPVSHEGSIYGY